MLEKQEVAHFSILVAHFGSPDLTSCRLSQRSFQVHLFKPPDFDETEALGDCHFPRGNEKIRLTNGQKISRGWLKPTKCKNFES